MNNLEDRESEHLDVGSEASRRGLKIPVRALVVRSLTRLGTLTIPTPTKLSEVLAPSAAGGRIVT